MKLTEFEIHAYLFIRLIEMGFNARGEVKSLFVTDEEELERKARFDIVIFGKDNEPLEIIEVKDNEIHQKHKTLAQFKRYQKYNLPLTFVDGIHAANCFLSKIGETSSEYRGKYGRAKPFWADTCNNKRKFKKRFEA